MQTKKPEKALKYFTDGDSCSQAIMATYGPIVGLTIEQCFQVGSGLGGGIGRKQYVCGAINAGAIILGLKFGNSTHEEPDKKEFTSQIVARFVSDCELELGSSQCAEMLNIDLNNFEQKTIAKESGLFDRVCNNAVLKTAQLLDVYLEERY